MKVHDGEITNNKKTNNWKSNDTTVKVQNKSYTKKQNMMMQVEGEPSTRLNA